MGVAVGAVDVGAGLASSVVAVGQQHEAIQRLASHAVRSVVALCAVGVRVVAKLALIGGASKIV